MAEDILSGGSDIVSPVSGSSVQVNLANTLQAGSGSASDNTTLINSAIAASPFGSEIVFPPGTTAVNGTIVLKSDRRYRGSHYHTSIIQQASGANLSVPLVASSGWVNNSTTTDNPVHIENLGIDGNKANNTGLSVGLMLMSWESLIRSCFIVNTTSHGIQITDKNSAAGLLTNTQVENRIDSTRVYAAGGHGIWVDDNTSGTVHANTDGFITDCIVGSPAIGGIRCDRAAGWKIDGNHVYNVGEAGILASNCWATRISGSYVEGGFGQSTGTINGFVLSSSPAGIGADVISGSGSGALIFGNHVSMPSDPANGNTFHYIRANSAASSRAIVFGNIINAGSAGASHLGLRTQGSGSVEEFGNFISSFGAGKFFSLGATTATPLNLAHDLDLNTIGKGLRVAEGTNAKQGVATLSAGTVVVSNTSVTASSRIILTAQDNSSAGALRVSARTAGTSFTITSSNGADSGVVAYQIFEPG